MITPTALGTSSTLSSALAQTSGSGGVSWETVVLVGIIGIVILAIVWLLFGQQSSKGAD